MSVGRVLSGRYELLRLLGRGGMAEVFAARDQTLGREVAVKLLLDRFLEDASFTRRFQDEARHVARLNHANLVAVYDTGIDANQPYIVMELVEGRSLQDAIRAGGLTEDRALEIVADVCSALAYAHDRGLIHRDIKPGNILLADDGAVKVTDFGIARAVDNETVTRTAAVLGTAAYLSPEQAQGRDVDPRSDLYSLGVVLYEALTGFQPFSGDSPVTVAYQHVQEAPRPPRERNPSISPAAEAITMRALAKNPANRYQHAGEMLDDVLNARDGQPVGAPAVMTAEETALLQPAFSDMTPGTKQHRRRRVVGYTLLVIAALAAMGGILWFLATMLTDEEVPQVSVPNVVGEPLEVADGMLRDAGLEPGDTTEEASDSIPPGNVIRQRPVAEQLVDEGSRVDLVVSVGQESTVVPNLLGLSEDDAVEQLIADRLVVGERQTEFSTTVPEGRIIAHTPAGGDEVPVGTRVDYTVSLGQEVVAVRAVENRALEDAQFRLEEQGLDVRIERENSDVVAEGFVISQDPPAGTQVPVGTIVTIVVSLGPEETEEPPADEPPADEPPDDGGGNGPPDTPPGQTDDDTNTDGGTTDGSTDTTA
ncbi:MAG: PASTA domain-containing protein [Nitriliruptoraceae bacterium]